jgi:hypothetical protein
MITPNEMPMTFFNLEQGVVTTQADQTLADAFAADFQGLRHFGNKIGEAIDLGPAWTGMLRESDLTLGYAYDGTGADGNDPGSGLVMGESYPLDEMLTEICQHQAEA